jgi:hypothetical protein
LAGGGAGGLFGSVVGAVGGVAKKFKFASGGEVPPGFPNDSFPGFLSSGENVLTARTSDSLEKAIANGGLESSNSAVLRELQRLNANLERGQNLQVNWTADGLVEKLILNLNHRGVRLA